MRVVTFAKKIGARQRKTAEEQSQGQPKGFGNVQTRIIAESAIEMVHQINDPLTVIKGYLQFFEKSTDNSRQDWLMIVFQELNRIETLIDNFVMVSQDHTIEKNQHS